MRHLDDDLLLKILQGQMPPRVLLQAMYDHLRDLCPECRANLELVAAEMDWRLDEPPAAAPQVAGADYSTAFHAASVTALECAERLESERRDAERHLAELRALPVEAWPGYLAAARPPSRALAERLLAECRRVVRHDPDEARRWAELVPEVLDLIPGSHDQSWADELHARALAHRGNALRVGGDVGGADRTFLVLRRFLAGRALEHADLHPDVASLEASLRIEQGRFQEALERLDVAVKLAQVAGDDQELARFLIKRGDVHRYDGRLAEARQDLEQALSLLDPEADGELFMCAVGNYCTYLSAAGEHDEARRVLARHATLFPTEDSWVEARLASLRGFIAHGSGEVDEAESWYLHARDGYIAQDQPFRAARLSLELARLYLEQGRRRDLAELARWMGKVFESRELPNRAAVALMLFQQAVAAEQVTIEALQGLRICLEQAQSGGRRAGDRPS
jgi:tetratricopeptide (TPR) repeat protein